MKQIIDDSLLLISTCGRVPAPDHLYLQSAASNGILVMPFKDLSLLFRHHQQAAGQGIERPNAVHEMFKIC